jgi:hypothetical protein
MTTDLKPVVRRYVSAWARVMEASAGELLAAICERDAAFHEMVAAVGPCPMCESGSCPYVLDDDELEAIAAIERVEQLTFPVDVVDTKGRL